MQTSELCADNMARQATTLLLVTGMLTASAQSELFIVRTEFDDADQSCSTWQSKEVEGVQDLCQLIGDAEQHGLTSPTGKAYIKRSCTETHYIEGWYSDSSCTSLLETSMNETTLMNRTLACSYTSLYRSYNTYHCSQSFTVARWSRYEDSSCQIKDTTLPEEFYALDFCHQSQTGSFEGDTKSQQYSCSSSGLQRTFFKNSNCTGSSWVKTDSAVGNDCADSWYYYGHVKLDSSCPFDPVSSYACVPFDITSLGISLASFWLLAYHV
mmetsp:Transcript_61158/g.108778  ORF Transcript_61158/g.108778 Transcript_61158/m.108778 type:complete len:268 (+) Transcript_61158:19-822(+)